MENINEELNYMKYLLEYKKGVVISEQVAQTQPQAQPKQQTKIAANIEIPKMALYSVKSFGYLYIKDKYELNPSVLLKYAETSAIIVGNFNNEPNLFVGSLPQGNDPTRISNLNISPISAATGWNEYQWVSYINTYDNGSIPANAIAQFLTNIKTKIGANFGTLTPDKLGPAVKNDPNKLKKYQEAIAISGINPNFKKG